MPNNLLPLQLLTPDVWGLNSQLSVYSLLAMCAVSLVRVRKMNIAWSGLL